MGQKVHPIGMRVGVIRDWNAKWYAEKEYAEYLHEDLKIRKYIATRLADASVSTIDIERAANRVNVSIHTAKPGIHQQIFQLRFFLRLHHYIRIRNLQIQIHDF